MQYKLRRIQRASELLGEFWFKLVLSLCLSPSPGSLVTKKTSNVAIAAAVSAVTQAAAAVSTTIQLVFNSQILSADVWAHYDSFNSHTKNMT